MNKREAVELLSTYLPPGILALVVQAFEQDTLARAPARADGHISYQEAQRRRLCPYCGEPGEPAHFEIDCDPDFDKYECPNNHGFFVERKRA